VAIGEDFEYRTSPDTFLASRCRSCGLIYLNPRPLPESLDQIYPPNYHAYTFTPEQFGFAHTARQWLEAHRLLRYCNGLGNAARIIDVGCGDGFHLDLLRRYGNSTWSLEGVDASPRAVAAGRNRQLTIHAGRLEDLHLSSESYDLALVIATIEHVENPVQLLIEVARVLRSGGKAVVVTDNTGTADFHIFGRRHWGGYHFPRHWNLFDRRSLVHLAEQAGLEVITVQTSVSPVNWVYSIRNSLVDHNAPHWIIERFSLKSPFSLAFFTMIDTLCQLTGHGALLRMVVRRR
jgi:SAM-dependent methyltransferase